MSATTKTERLIPISQPGITEAERSAVLAVLESGMLAQGPRVAGLEAGFARVAGTEHAVAVSNGTAALQVALLAAGVGPGDEVITSPFSFVATVNMILAAGARPVFADIRPEDWNLDPDRLEALVTERTRAVLPVHLYGLMADMTAIEEIARARGLTIIEDAAQAVGATERGRPAGSFGIGCFSLYATKNVMSGEGGMITTSDAEVAERARLLRSHGQVSRYSYAGLGYNLRMSDLHAAIGEAQLARLPQMLAARRRNAAFLSAGLRTVDVPQVPAGREHTWHQYTVRVRGDRDAAAARLRELGIGTGVYYPEPLHRLDHVRAVIGEVSLPVAERAATEVLSLPVHPGLKDHDLDAIVEAVNSL